MEKVVHRFKRYIVYFVLWLLIIVLALATMELGVVLFEQIMAPPLFLLDANKLFEVFSFALVLLIGLELIESVEFYLSHTSARPWLNRSSSLPSLPLPAKLSFSTPRVWTPRLSLPSPRSSWR